MFVTGVTGWLLFAAEAWRPLRHLCCHTHITYFTFLMPESRLLPLDNSHHRGHRCVDIHRGGIHQISILALPERRYATLGIARIPLLQILQKGVHISRHPLCDQLFIASFCTHLG